jgi:hypothetical protein
VAKKKIRTDFFFVGKTEGERQLGRWGYNVIMDCREVGWEAVNWTDVAWNEIQ